MAPASIPFPVAVGDTWVYQTTAPALTALNSLTTNKIVSAGPTAAGYQVTMSETTGLAGSVTTAQQVYIFYPDGTIGYPVTDANGVSVTGNGVRWPDAAVPPPARSTTRWYPSGSARRAGATRTPMSPSRAPGWRR